MLFESFNAALLAMLFAGFVLAFILGATANKTNFCTMGAVSDWVNIGDKNRLRAWVLAMAIAMIGVVVLEYFGAVNADQSFPPYRTGTLNWLDNVVGGLLFGIGMTFASGCGNKTLVRLGAGNLKSLFVFAVIAVIAYFMVNPLPGSDQTLYSLFFLPWTGALAISLDGGQDLGSLIAGENAINARLIIGGIIAAVMLVFVFKSNFTRDKDNVASGIIFGLVILAGWFITTNLAVNVDDEAINLSNYYAEWDMLADSDEGKPNAGAGLSPQSFTFINPMGQAFGYGLSGFNAAMLTFGLLAFFGVIAGSFVWSMIAKSFKIEWFASGSDFFIHLIGAILMGFGGVLAMGCTIGQGITGVSTLAIGSFLTLFSIVFGSAITMKIQLYKMIYEEEASFSKALVAGLADMKLLPERLRKLDKVA